MFLSMFGQVQLTRAGLPSLLFVLGIAICAGALFGHIGGRMVRSKGLDYRWGFALGCLLNLVGLLMCWMLGRGRKTVPRYQGKHRPVRTFSQQSGSDFFAPEGIVMFTDTFGFPVLHEPVPTPPWELKFKKQAVVAQAIPPKPVKSGRMICPKCHMRWTDDYVYCGNCGTETVVRR